MLKHWCEQIDGNVVLLFIATVIFLVAALIVEWKFANDGVAFQLVASLVVGSSSALFALMTKREKPPGPPSPPEAH